MISEGFVTNGAKVYISSRDGKACDQAAKELTALGTHIISSTLTPRCLHTVTLPNDIKITRSHQNNQANPQAEAPSPSQQTSNP